MEKFFKQFPWKTTALGNFPQPFRHTGIGLLHKGSGIWPIIKEIGITAEYHYYDNMRLSKIPWMIHIGNLWSVDSHFMNARHEEIWTDDDIKEFNIMATFLDAPVTHLTTDRSMVGFIFRLDHLTPYLTF